MLVVSTLLDVPGPVLVVPGPVGQGDKTSGTRGGTRVEVHPEGHTGNRSSGVGGRGVQVRGTVQRPVPSLILDRESEGRGPTEDRHGYSARGPSLLGSQVWECRVGSGDHGSGRR